jgi:hypothetical protein
MRTPCQEAPEAWVGDDRDLRAQAARDCIGCHRFDDCRNDAEANPPASGVMAGVDYTKSRKVGRPRTAFRVCALCGIEFHKGMLSSKQWAARKFCGRGCAVESQRRVSDAIFRDRVRAAAERGAA